MTFVRYKTCWTKKKAFLTVTPSLAPTHVLTPTSVARPRKLVLPYALGGLASSTSSVRVPRHDPSSVRAFRGVVHGSLGGVNAVTDVPIQESKLVTEITDTTAVGGL